MNNDTRRLVVGMLAAMAVFVAYRYIVNEIYPPPPTPPLTATLPTPEPAAVAQAPASAPLASTPTSASDRTYELVAGPLVAAATLGGQDGDALRVELDQRGAAVTALYLYTTDQRGRFVHGAKPHVNEPYQLLSAVDDGAQIHRSFETYRVWVDERDGQPWSRSWPLADLTWTLAEVDTRHATFTTAIRSEVDGQDLVRLSKTYTLRPGKPVVELGLSVVNASSATLKVRIEQSGPLGIGEESQYYDLRRLLVAQRAAKGVTLTATKSYSDLQKATLDANTGYLSLLKPDQGPVLWTALANKYFAVFTRPVPQNGDVTDGVAAVNALVAAPHLPAPPGDLLAHGDLLARFVTKPVVLAPSAGLQIPFEIYAGPKDAEYIRQADPAYADPAKLYFQIIRSADAACFCSFLWLEELMLWLLDKIHSVVRNYGIGIMVLVVIVRSLLHPLSKFQQKSMFRMQEGMARLQPKLNAIKERYPNDKVKQNQETMKVWSEEGVNPAASFVSFVPMFIQMPILVALWTALNTDIHLRHAPFDGWWIKDLAAPDAFLTFDPPITIPILGQLPLLGSVFAGVTSLNLLPVLMGVSMWLQQKYMPKPQVKAKLDAAHQRDPSKPRTGPSPQDQLRQQQIMAYMMSILFPLMFYKMPSGLSLYWMASTVYGIGESLLIRRQLEEERQRREREGAGPKLPRRPGVVARVMKRLAAQAEEWQHKADALAKVDEGARKDRKKPN